MSLRGDDMFSLFQIVEQRGFYFLSEVDDCLISTFSPDLDAAVIEIHIINIQSYTFRYTNTGSQKKGQQSNIAKFCFLMIFQLFFGQLSAVLHLIQQNSHFVGL